MGIFIYFFIWLHFVPHEVLFLYHSFDQSLFRFFLLPSGKFSVLTNVNSDSTRAVATLLLSLFLLNCLFPLTCR